MIEQVYDFVSLNFADMVYIYHNQSSYNKVKLKNLQKIEEMKRKLAEKFRMKAADFLTNILKAKREEEEKELME